jgi:hypothetical protein
VEVTQREHELIHARGWNEEWGDFFDANPAATAAQIGEFASELVASDPLLAGRPIIPFSR